MKLIEPIAKFDLALSLFCMQHRFSQPIARISRVISRTGDGHLYVVLALLMYWLDEQLGSIFLISGAISFVIELPLYWCLKNMFQRRRPHELSSCITAYIVPSDRFSLPSGHTAAGFVMAMLIAHFYPAWAELAFIWGTLIGASRILLGVHFCTDVLIGCLLGMACAQLGLFIALGVAL